MFSLIHLIMKNLLPLAITFYINYCNHWQVRNIRKALQSKIRSQPRILGIFLFIFLALFPMLRLLLKKMFVIYNHSLNSDLTMHVNNLWRIFFPPAWPIFWVKANYQGTQITHSHILESNPNSIIIHSLASALTICLRQVIILSELDHQLKK